MPPSDDLITALARQYPKGCQLTKAQQVEACLSIGRVLPRPTKAGSRRLAYGRDPVEAFLVAWNAAGGMVLHSSAVKISRQVYHTLADEHLIDATVHAQVTWTALRELCQERVPGPLRTRLLGELCSGTLKASEVAVRVGMELAGQPRGKRLPKHRLEVLRRINSQVTELEKSIKESASSIGAAMQTDEEATALVVATVTAKLRTSLRQWRDELKKVHRRRSHSPQGSA